MKRYRAAGQSRAASVNQRRPTARPNEMSRPRGSRTLFGYSQVLLTF